MREIITIQIGQAGNAIGEKFWKFACDEHGLDLDGYYHGQSDLQLERINIYFNEIQQGKYIPRSIFTDLDEIRNTNMKRLFNPQWFIQGKTGASNNFAKGFFTEGAELLPELTDLIRKISEECDLVHGFQLIHSISGGAGGGFGSLVLDHIREDYTDRIIKSYSIIPALSMSQVVVEPYNAILSMNHLIENTDETFCFDNMALFEILNKILHLPSANFDDINQILTQVIIGITACLRFPGQLNMDLRKLAVNMIPFPNLHFLSTSFSPLHAHKIKSYQTSNEYQLIKQMFEKNNQMLTLNSPQGKYLTATGIFRGQNLSLKILHDLMVKEKIKENFIPWIPNNCKIAHCDIPPQGFSQSVTGIANHTGIIKQFHHLIDPFEKLFQRRAFLHWFVGEGMEENELSEANEQIKNLINQYKEYEKR